jgi:hypothetical protein
MSGTAQRPYVVIVGGFLTEPLFYRPMRARLLARGASGVVVTPLHLPDWLAITFAGMRPAMLRTARSIRAARGASPAPLIVIGHSAGGILSRLAMSPHVLDGRLPSVAGDVGCLVTLGTPHRLRPSMPWRHPGVRAAELLDREAPGAAHLPTTGYLTVGSTLVSWDERVPTNLFKQGLGAIMRRFVGPMAGGHGDGIVEDECCHLEGADHLSLPDVLHGTVGGPWYGDARVIDRWWPAAVDAWRKALAAREAAPDQRERRATAGGAVAAAVSAA